MRRLCLVVLLVSPCLLIVAAEGPSLAEKFKTVKVERYYAIPQKDGKTEFDFATPESQACVQSLLPH